jgi:hypothetical protein
MASGLAGDLTVMPMEDLVLYLGNRQLSGVLILRREQVQKRAVIQDGQVISTSSSDPREYLSQFLINFGHLTEEQVTAAMRLQNDEKLPFGRALLKLGLLPEETVKSTVVLKARETLLEVFRWPQGQFEFNVGPTHPDEDGVAARVPMLDLHREGQFRETAWQAIRQTFPTGSLTLKLDQARLGREQIGQMDQKLFDAVKEGLSIDELVFSLHTTDFHLYQRLYALYRKGAIAPGPEKVASRPASRNDLGVVGEEMPVTGLLNHAREFFQEGRFAESEVLCQRILEMGDMPGAMELLKQSEAALLDMLRVQLPQESIPELAVEASRIRGPDLSPPEKYLLSRVDGLRDIRGIVHVAPLRELDALKYFQRFVEGGLVRFRE